MSKKKTFILPGPSKFPTKKPAKAPTLSLAEKTIEDLEWLKEVLEMSYKRIFSSLFWEGGDTLLDLLTGQDVSKAKSGGVRKSYSLSHETVQAMDRIAKQLGISRSVLVDVSVQVFAWHIRESMAKEAEGRKSRLPQVLALKKAFEEMDASFWRDHSEVFGMMEDYIYQFLEELEGEL